MFFSSAVLALESLTFVYTGFGDTEGTVQSPGPTMERHVGRTASPALAEPCQFYLINSLGPGHSHIPIFPMSHCLFSYIIT